MIEDAGEIAQLASEFISSMDNVPQEVQHIIKEIEHKDAKIQELLPKLAAREGQLRDTLAKKDATLNESDKLKVEKLSEKIKADYARADEWSAQKEVLSRDLWRNINAHTKRLEVEIAKVSPILVSQVENALSATLSSQSQIPSTNTISNAVLGALRSPSVEASLDLSAPSGVKRRFSGTPVTKGRQSSTDRGLPSPSPLSGNPFNALSGNGASIGSNGLSGSIPQKKMKHSGLSIVTKPESEADVEGELGVGNEEKDDRVYCHCQRVSFGEMIGCDSDDCPYEWFHLSCVGLSKPLPQTWYCTDCRERIEREKTERPIKKRKKQQA